VLLEIGRNCIISRPVPLSIKTTPNNTWLTGTAQLSTLYIPHKGSVFGYRTRLFIFFGLNFIDKNRHKLSPSLHKNKRFGHETSTLRPVEIEADAQNGLGRAEFRVF